MQQRCAYIIEGVPANYADRRVLKIFWRSIVEIAFIIFLFYANLLMGEFTRDSQHHRTLLSAFQQIVTWTTFSIALVSSVIGYFGFEYIRKRV